MIEDRKLVIEKFVKDYILDEEFEIVYYKEDLNSKKGHLDEIFDNMKNEQSNILRIEISYMDVRCICSRISFLVMHLKIFKGNSFSNVNAINNIMVVDIDRKNMEYRTFIKNVFEDFIGSVIENKVNVLKNVTNI
jgi:hypothetical protein